tara:strand:- start:511 stop:849 length:339 start_codon:yes stop_codon:yes gene_type:complete
VVIAIGVASFLLGKKKANEYRIQAQMTKELYEREREAIEIAHKNKSKKKDEAVELYKEAMAAANRRYMRSKDGLEKKRAARVADLVEANKNDPDAINRIFEKEFGFRISEKK